mmetsp:Transcript_83283/g.129992  ORF Transcript_83283/g.129992 Transcript_83283/m.129992 type:complete len:225 (-) Transcript_83283:34-708(-)|eukprot:CAMPEP_0169188444 /NCGR_PEP_ID=MMETSP1016-20121227/3464_1 /TAXON_ID=342587 /ORGANISM="Karlodinium micrum, Strain CCMP2283" /LENGTH=224 /DNA_ID=CAMNT_0009264477 /DNA_START=56 /DNA_END=730 /DNA_ORIENTATION=-
MAFARLLALALLTHSSAFRSKPSTSHSTGNPCQCGADCKPALSFNDFQNAYSIWIATKHTAPGIRAAAWHQCKATCTSLCLSKNANQSFPTAVQPVDLVRLATDISCLVAPLAGGWAQGSADLNACTYFKPIPMGQKDHQEYGRFMDPRTGLCFGWVEWKGHGSDFIIPGHQGPAIAQCGTSDGSVNSLDVDHDFHTMLEVSFGGNPCIMTNRGEKTDFCFQTG